MKELRRSYRGDSPQQGHAPALERRYWPREAAKEAEASISWMSGREMVTVKAHLVNLSQGGAGVLIQQIPPRGALLRLALASDRTTNVDGQAVELRLHHKRGWLFLHMKFDRECPRALYERAVETDGDDAGDED